MKKTKNKKVSLIPSELWWYFAGSMIQGILMHYTLVSWYSPLIMPVIWLSIITIYKFYNFLSE